MISAQIVASQGDDNTAHHARGINIYDDVLVAGATSSLLHVVKSIMVEGKDGTDTTSILVLKYGEKEGTGNFVQPKNSV